MTYYPSTAIDFSYKSFGQIINADDVNNAYDEIIAIGNTFGTSPQFSASWGSGTFSTTTNWTTVKERIQNIEHGLYATINDYVSKSGGSVILPTAAVKALVLKGAASQSANMFEVQANGSSVPVMSVTVTGAVSAVTAVISGALQAGSIDGGSA